MLVFFKITIGNIENGTFETFVICQMNNFYMKGEYDGARILPHGHMLPARKILLLYEDDTDE